MDKTQKLMLDLCDLIIKAGLSEAYGCKIAPQIKREAEHEYFLLETFLRTKFLN